MIIGIFVTAYMIGLVSFSQWGDIGGIAETCIMVLLSVAMIKQQYDRIRNQRPGEWSFNANGVLHLLVMLCLTLVCHVPAGPWINRALLLGMTLINGYGVFAAKEEKGLKNSFLPTAVFGVFCLIVTFVGKNLPSLI